MNLLLDLSGTEIPDSQNNGLCREVWLNCVEQRQNPYG